MNVKLMSHVLSLLLSLGLLSGVQVIHDLAFWSIAIVNVLGWLVLPIAWVVTGRLTSLGEQWQVSVALSAFQIVALAMVNHPVLAASNLVLSALILLLVFRKEPA